MALCERENEPSLSIDTPGHIEAFYSFPGLHLSVVVFQQSWTILPGQFVIIILSLSSEHNMKLNAPFRCCPKRVNVYSEHWSCRPTFRKRVGCPHEHCPGLYTNVVPIRKILRIQTSTKLNGGARGWCAVYCLMSFFRELSEFLNSHVWEHTIIQQGREERTLFSSLFSCGDVSGGVKSFRAVMESSLLPTLIIIL